MSPQSAPFDAVCTFCKIAHGDDGKRVFDDEHTLAFLDHRPLFPGHCLLVPKAHYETIEDLPQSLIAPLFANARMLATAVREGMGAEGTFIAANNGVSQSVPHFHVHIVPRTRGDGLKGFFWPRRKYGSAEEMDAIMHRLREAIVNVKEH
jgi:histidine triad (HIT) family protein